MQLRKHAAPALPDSFFTAGVAVPPRDPAGPCRVTGATLVADTPDLPAAPPWPRAWLSWAARVMAATAMTAIPRGRYMSVSVARKAWAPARRRRPVSSSMWNEGPRAGARARRLALRVVQAECEAEHREPDRAEAGRNERGPRHTREVPGRAADHRDNDSD